MTIKEQCAKAHTELYQVVEVIKMLEYRILELETENQNLRQRLEMQLDELTPNDVSVLTLDDLRVRNRTYNLIAGCHHNRGGRALDIFTSNGKEVLVSKMIQHKLSDYMQIWHFGRECACDLIGALYKRGLALQPETNSQYKWFAQQVLEQARSRLESE